MAAFRSEVAGRDEALVEPQVGLHSLWIDPSVSCVRSSAGLIEVFSARLHETGGGISAFYWFQNVKTLTLREAECTPNMDLMAAAEKLLSISIYLYIDTYSEAFLSLSLGWFGEGRRMWSTSASYNEAGTVSWDAVPSGSLRIRLVAGMLWINPERQTSHRSAALD